MSCLLSWAMNYFGWAYYSIEEVDKETEDSPELEALWLRLRARSRGHHDIKALLDDAKDTTHFAHCNEHDVVDRVYDHYKRKGLRDFTDRYLNV